MNYSDALAKQATARLKKSKRVHKDAAKYKRCSVDGCQSLRRSILYCHNHRERLRRTGRLELESKVDGFFRRVDKTGACWNWTGGHLYNGYGRLSFNGRIIAAHRLSFELAGGVIPEGLELDHLCRNRKCVNPSHLEAVTHRENVLRGNSPAAINMKKTECPKGHRYDELNTRDTKDGERLCVSCKKAADSEYRKTHSEKYKQYQRKYREEHREQLKQNRQVRREKKRRQNSEDEKTN